MPPIETGVFSFFEDDPRATDEQGQYDLWGSTMERHVFNLQRVFDNRNPHIWLLFKDYVDRARAAGHLKYSARTIIHLLRWHETVLTRRVDKFKVGDHIAAYFSRKYIYEFPSRADFFELRVPLHLQPLMELPDEQN